MIVKIAIDEETYEKVEKIATIKGLTPEELIKNDVNEMIKSYDESL